jgi:hypothetical protein
MEEAAQLAAHGREDERGKKSRLITKKGICGMIGRSTPITPRMKKIAQARL